MVDEDSDFSCSTTLARDGQGTQKVSRKETELASSSRFGIKAAAMIADVHLTNTPCFCAKHEYCKNITGRDISTW